MVVVTRDKGGDMVDKVNKLDRKDLNGMFNGISIRDVVNHKVRAIIKLSKFLVENINKRDVLVNFLKENHELIMTCALQGLTRYEIGTVLCLTNDLLDDLIRDDKFLIYLFKLVDQYSLRYHINIARNCLSNSRRIDGKTYAFLMGNLFKWYSDSINKLNEIGVRLEGDTYSEKIKDLVRKIENKDITLTAGRKMLDMLLDIINNDVERRVDVLEQKIDDFLKQKGEIDD